ncbi:hypothetical protein LR48_Vigan08g057600 [Vigna angularis]|uniref:Uncharacterized protein n=1 Tax=Phaseolus angularis TaxID=3914 RepID=A0A0L9V4W6_PHAAN|nr:hypothetical protein LR48_Vigan08g057600 [Vigna angularis]
MKLQKIDPRLNGGWFGGSKVRAGEDEVANLRRRSLPAVASQRPPVAAEVPTAVEWRATTMMSLCSGVSVPCVKERARKEEGREGRRRFQHWRCRRRCSCLAVGRDGVVSEAAAAADGEGGSGVVAGDSSSGEYHPW